MTSLKVLAEKREFNRLCAPLVSCWVVLCCEDEDEDEDDGRSASKHEEVPIR